MITNCMEKIKIERKAYLKYLETNGDMRESSLKALELGMSLEVFMSHVKNYIDKFKVESKHAGFFQNILEAESEDKAVAVLKNSKLNISDLNKDFAIFLVQNYYGTGINTDKILMIFERRLRAYNRYLEKTNSKKDKNIDERVFLYASNLIKFFIESDFSRERFCYQSKISFTYFSEQLRIVRKYNPVLYQKYVKKMEIEEMKFNENIKNDIYKLLELMKNNNRKLSLIEFFMSTNYGFVEIKKHADLFLTPQESKFFRTNLPFSEHKEVFNSNQIQSLFTTNYTIKYVDIPFEISEDVKIIALEYLRKNKLPITMQTFSESIVLHLTNVMNEKRK